jgi:putative ABC transport system substrate-binding protein
MIAKAFRVVLVIGIGMLFGTPLNSAEQAGRLPRIGVLWPGAVDQWVKAFHEGLRENGYVDGATAVIDIRATGGNVDSGPRMAEELIARDPDVIFAVPGVLVKDVADAEKRAGKQIPIVFITQDPVAEGLLGSAARPGGNITGLAGVSAPGDFMTKHLQLLKEMLPRLRRIACLIDTSWKDFSSQTKAALEKAGPGIGVRVSSIDVRGPDDLDRALSEVVRKRADAMIIPLTPMFLAARTRIISFASKHRLPAAYEDEVFTYQGGLMSYGFSVADRYRRAAGVVAKILHGAKPADIPVDYSVRYRFVVNLPTAKALGIRIPESVLIQADEVIR